MATNVTKKNVSIFAMVIILGASLVFGCTSDLKDYWASLRGLGGEGDGGDTGSDGDSDTDTDGDTDTECIEDSGSCGGDEDAGPIDWDAGPDGGTFCESSGFSAFMGMTPVSFDNSQAPYRGTPGAPVEITTFSYFLCPACVSAAADLESTMADPAYSGEVVHYFRHYCFSSDPATMNMKNHMAAEAGKLQGDFWSMHDAIYANFPLTNETTLLALAQGAGYDMTSFLIGYSSAGVYNRIIDDKNVGYAAGVTGTPSIFINGRRVVPWTYYDEIVECLVTNGVPDAGP